MDEFGATITLLPVRAWCMSCCRDCCCTLALASLMGEDIWSSIYGINFYENLLLMDTGSKFYLKNVLPFVFEGVTEEPWVVGTQLFIMIKSAFLFEFWLLYAVWAEGLFDDEVKGCGVRYALSFLFLRLEIWFWISGNWMKSFEFVKGSKFFRFSLM